MRKVTVSASESYDIFIGSGVLDRVGEQIAKVFPKTEKVFLLSDDTVFSLYGKKVCDRITEAGYLLSNYVVPHGEASKSTENFVKVLEALAEAGLTKTDLLVALGGGVVGDLGGFAAACYLRGIAFLQLPTTLLSAVDSSVGGKTAINLTAGKNLAGAFHQPGLVLMDTDTLETLPPEVLRDGCGEVIKYAVLRDETLFEALFAGISYAKSEECIAKCVEYKKYYVEQDEYDTGVRHFLNLGHTVAHAIEKKSGYAVSHGEAVAMGMKNVAEASVRVGKMGEKDLERLSALLAVFGFADCPYENEEMIEYMYSDKKTKGKEITLVLPEAIGRCSLYRLPTKELKDFFV